MNKILVFFNIIKFSFKVGGWVAGLLYYKIIFKITHRDKNVIFSQHVHAKMSAGTQNIRVAVYSINISKARWINARMNIFFLLVFLIFLSLYKRLQGQSWSDIDEAGIHLRNRLRILGLHVLDKVDDPVGVPELVVVPGHQLHKGRGQLNTGLKYLTIL